MNSKLFPIPVVAEHRPVFVLKDYVDPENVSTLRSFSNEKEVYAILLLSEQSSLCSFTHKDVSLVINFEFPTSVEAYWKRIARYNLE